MDILAERIDVINRYPIRYCHSIPSALNLTSPMITTWPQYVHKSKQPNAHFTHIHLSRNRILIAGLPSLSQIFRRIQNHLESHLRGLG